MQREHASRVNYVGYGQWKWKVEEARLCNSLLITLRLQRFFSGVHAPLYIPCVYCTQTENKKSHSVSIEIHLKRGF